MVRGTKRFEPKSVATIYSFGICFAGTLWHHYDPHRDARVAKSCGSVMLIANTIHTPFETMM